MRNRVTFGYEMKNGNLSVEETQSSIVLQIFEMYLSGTGLVKIASILNQDAIPSPDNKNWTHGSVGKLLKNRQYIGSPPYPPLLPAETFEQAQRRRQELSKKTGKGTDSEHRRKPYEGMIFCGCCGRKYQRIHYQKRIAWPCSLHIRGNREKNGNICGNKRWLTDEQIEKAFIRLQNRIFDKAVLIREPLPCNTQRLDALKAKYSEMLENPGGYEEKSFADIIFWIAAEEYAQSKGAEDQMILQAVEEAGRTAEFQADIFLNIVRKITVTETEMSFELINGQKIPNV